MSGRTTTTAQPPAEDGRRPPAWAQRRRAAAEAVVGGPWAGLLLKLPVWRGVLALAYHRIAHSGSDPPETAFHPGVFSATASALEAQLRFLTRHLEVVSPEAIERDPDALGRRVTLTFDDGYRDNYELALPLLRKHGVPATFFLATRFLDDPGVAWWDEIAWMVKRSSRQALEAGDWWDRRLPLHGDRRPAIDALTRAYKSLPGARTEAFLDACAEATGAGRCDPATGADLWMTWEMAAEMRDAGMAIGGHSATHPVLARAEPAAQAQEIDECARRLRSELGLAMRLFAYPVGLPESFDDHTRRLLRGAGVKLAFSLYGGHLRPRQLDPYDVPRATVGTSSARFGFRAMLAAPRLFARW